MKQSALLTGDLAIPSDEKSTGLYRLSDCKLLTDLLPDQVSIVLGFFKSPHGETRIVLLFGSYIGWTWAFHMIPA